MNQGQTRDQPSASWRAPEPPDKVQCQQEAEPKDAGQVVEVDPRFYELIEAMESDNLHKLQELVDDGAPITRTADSDRQSYPLHGGSALHMAARRGNGDQLGVLLGHAHASRLVNTKDMWESTPLMYSAAEGQVDIVQLLLRHDADISARSGDHRTVLHAAAERGDAAVLCELLRHPDCAALVGARDGQGHTPLRCAEEANRGDAARILLLRGARFAGQEHALHGAADSNCADALVQLLKDPQATALVNHTDAQGRTALMYAAMRQNVDTVRLLIDSGALCTIKDKEMRTVIHFAARNNNAAVLHEILRATTSETVLNDPDTQGRTALMFASRKGNAEAVHLLLEKGAFVAKTDGDMRTVLHFAVESEGVATLGELLSHADARTLVDVGDKAGRTPLLSAVSSGNIEAVNLLLGNGARVTDRDDFWCSALHLAAYNGDVAMLSELLANPDTKSLVNDEDDEDFTPLMSAACRGKVEAVRLLLDNGASRKETFGNSTTIINNTAKMGRTAILKELLTGSEATVLANLPDDKGCTPLMFASGADKIRLLLEAGASVTARNRKRRSVLHFAAENVNVEVLREFLKHSAASALVNDADDDGRTPLMAAVGSSNVEAVRLLLKKGARYADTDSKGRSVLHVAVDTTGPALMGGTSDVLRELLKCPDVASLVNVQDKQGHTALHYAKKIGNVEAVQELLQNGAR